MSMTPEEFKTIRTKLGLTQQQMAEWLGYGGKHLHRTVRRWEAGDRTIPPSVAKLMRFTLVHGREIKD